MANELTTTGNASAPEIARQHLRVSELYRSIIRDRGIDMLPARLSPIDRKQLQERKRELHAKLRAVHLASEEMNRARGSLAMFFAGYPNIAVQDKDGMSKAYLMVVRDYPLFAILSAIDDFRHGRVFDIGREGERVPFTLDRVPTAPRFLDQVKKCVAGIQEEHYQIGSLLAITKVADPSPVDDPVMAERVGKLMRGLADDMGMRAAKDRADEREKIRAEAQEARDRTQRILADARHRNAIAERISQDESIHG